jgi:hypothetical protein
MNVENNDPSKMQLKIAKPRDESSDDKTIDLISILKARITEKNLEEMKQWQQEFISKFENFSQNNSLVLGELAKNQIEVASYFLAHAHKTEAKIALHLSLHLLYRSAQKCNGKFMRSSLSTARKIISVIEIYSLKKESREIYYQAKQLLRNVHQHTR